MPTIQTMFFFLEQKSGDHVYNSDCVYLFETRIESPFLLFGPCLSFKNKNLESMPTIQTMFFFLEQKKWGPCLQFGPCLILGSGE